MVKEVSRGTRRPAGDVFQNIGGILDEPANDLRPADRREGASGEGEKKYRREQEHAGMTWNIKSKDVS